ncbi:MAG: hypothetical protein FLDDKLPJ_00846 [Phycisphaerae bacterium]|nr:hypothetical protein [Phycisphaerae bacterium]
MPQGAKAVGGGRAVLILPVLFPGEQRDQRIPRDGDRLRLFRGARRDDFLQPGGHRFTERRVVLVFQGVEARGGEGVKFPLTKAPGVPARGCFLRAIEDFSGEFGAEGSDGDAGGEDDRPAPQVVLRDVHQRVPVALGVGVSGSEIFLKRAVREVDAVLRGDAQQSGPFNQVIEELVRAACAGVRDFETLDRRFDILPGFGAGDFQARFFAGRWSVVHHVVRQQSEHVKTFISGDAVEGRFGLDPALGVAGFGEHVAGFLVEFDALARKVAVLAPVQGADQRTQERRAAQLAHAAVDRIGERGRERVLAFDQPAAGVRVVAGQLLQDGVMPAEDERVDVVIAQLLHVGLREARGRVPEPIVGLRRTGIAVGDGA